LLCPLCELNNEDDWHVFLTCNDSVLARQTAGLDHIVTARVQSCQTLSEIIFTICQEESRSTAGQFATLLYSVWNNRNNKVWNDKQESGRNIGVKSMQFWHDWYALQQHNATTEPHQQIITWQQPPLDWHKCNVDAGFYHDLNKTSAGWCLRDHLGRFLKAGTMWKEGKYSVREGEALALLEAMTIMEHVRVTKVIFETDSKCAVDAIYNLHSGTSEFSVIICNIKHILMSNPNFVVKFIKRQANMVAHTLARAAISWSSRYSFETVPLCIATYLNNEMI
jgi:ribonuclease HI